MANESDAGLVNEVRAGEGESLGTVTADDFESPGQSNRHGSLYDSESSSGQVFAC